MISVFGELISPAWDVLTEVTKSVPLWKHYRTYFPFCCCACWSSHASFALATCYIRQVWYDPSQHNGV